MLKFFVDHPRRLGETYFQHQRRALAFSMALLAASAAAFVHALLPCCFEKTASRTVSALNARLLARAEPMRLVSDLELGAEVSGREPRVMLET